LRAGRARNAARCASIARRRATVKHPLARHTPVSVNTRSRPPRCVRNPTDAWPSHNHTSTPYPNPTRRVFPRVRSTQINTPAAWSEPDEPYTTTAKTAKTSPISLPTKIPGAGNNTSHLRPKGQTTLTHTANWHPLGQQFSAPRPTTDRLSRRPRLQLDDPSRAPRSYDACVISPRRGRVAPSCPATGNPRPD